jgi:hypothetical protein
MDRIGAKEGFGGPSTWTPLTLTLSPERGGEGL